MVAAQLTGVAARLGEPSFQAGHVDLPHRAFAVTQRCERAHVRGAARASMAYPAHHSPFLSILNLILQTLNL